MTCDILTKLSTINLSSETSTHIAANDLIDVQALYVVAQLTEIPYQRAHTPWERMHAIH